MYNKIEDYYDTQALGTLNALELSKLLHYKLKDLNMTKIERAEQLAMVVHSKQYRKNRGDFKKTPYIEHPLRNTIRLIKWGVLDQDVLVASLLHDSVEDGSELFCKVLLNKTNIDMSLKKQYLETYIEETFGQSVSRIVKNVTNPEFTSKESKPQEYRTHVTRVIHNDPKTFLVKLSDFVDNAGGLPHTVSEDFVHRQAEKYLPLIKVFRSEFKNLKRKNELNLSTEGRLDIALKLDYTEKNLLRIVNKNRL